MSLYTLSKKIDRRYGEMTPNTKAWIFIAVVALILLLLLAMGWLVYDRYRHDAVVGRHLKELEESKQNYYLQTIANSNLEKKLQEMSLKLAETINNTIELERMFHELEEEKVSLEEIRDAMEKGIRRTKSQLDNMQGSVDALINQREKTIIYNREEIIHEKTNTHGKY